MKETKKYDVVGIGVCAIDLICLVSSYPKQNTKKKMLDFTIQGGGLIGTALVTLARLGAKVSYMGKLGQDEFSSFLIDDFMREKVDITKLKIVEGIRPPTAIILVNKSTGMRTIVWTDHGVARISVEDVDLDEIIGSTKMIHLDYIVLDLEAAIKIAKRARNKGVRVSIDAEVLVPNVEELLKLIDILIIPEEFSYQLTKEKNVEKAANIIKLKYSNEVICITSGEKGCYCVGYGESFHQPAFKVEVVDTTGCGDVFHGAFLYGLLRDLDLRRTARFASAVAALKCRKLGGRAGIPTFEEVKNFLAKHDSANR